MTVLFFGATADAVGKREIDFDLADGSTVGELLANLIRVNPGLAKHKLLIALNEEYVSSEVAVTEGDELAVFTAVSGG